MNVTGASGAANVGLVVRTVFDSNPTFGIQVTNPSRAFITGNKILGTATGLSNVGGATIRSFGDNSIGGTGVPTETITQK